MRYTQNIHNYGYCRLFRLRNPREKPRTVISGFNGMNGGEKNLPRDNKLKTVFVKFYTSNRTSKNEYELDTEKIKMNFYSSEIDCKMYGCTCSFL